MIKSFSIACNTFGRNRLPPACCRGGISDCCAPLLLAFGRELGNSKRRKVTQADVQDEGITGFGEEHKQAVVTNFSALSFTDMPIVLAQLQDVMLKHPMNPALNVTSRPPTKEEISRAPHTWVCRYEQKKDESAENNLVDIPDLFQLGVPFNVKYRGFESGGRDSQASYSGEVKFSLCGLPGKRATEPQLPHHHHHHHHLLLPV